MRKENTMATTVLTFVGLIETSDNNMAPSTNFVAQKVLATFPHGLRNARFAMAMYDSKGVLKWTHVFGESTDMLKAAMEIEFGPEDEGPKVA
jgi:hypothetical protein